MTRATALLAAGMQIYGLRRKWDIDLSTESRAGHSLPPGFVINFNGTSTFLEKRKGLRDRTSKRFVKKLGSTLEGAPVLIYGQNIDPAGFRRIIEEIRRQCTLLRDRTTVRSIESISDTSYAT
jgi:hypothetical protein